MRKAVAVATLAFASGAFVVWVSSAAFAQTPTPTASATAGAAKTCADFATQAAAQAYFNSKGGSKTNNVDNLDPNRNGIACEGLPGTPTASTTPAATVAPTATSQTLNNTGVFSDLMAMSGLSLLEVGLGLSLLSARVRAGTKRAPLFVLKLLAKAARQGSNEVALADDVYIVRKPAQPAQPAATVAAVPAPAPKPAPKPKPFVAERKPATVLLTSPIASAAVKRVDPLDEFAIAVIGLDDDDGEADWPYFTPPDGS